MEESKVFVDPNYRLNPILRKLPEPVLKNLLAHQILHYESKSRNEYLFFQDDVVNENSKVYFILSGKIKVMVKEGGVTNDFFSDVKDSLVGEMALLNSQVRSAGCVVHDRSTFYTMEKRHFRKIFYSPQEIAFYIREIMIEILLGKFNETNIRKKIVDSNYEIFLNKVKTLEELNLEMKNSCEDINRFNSFKDIFEKGISEIINRILAL